MFGVGYTNSGICHIKFNQVTSLENQPYSLFKNYYAFFENNKLNLVRLDFNNQWLKTNIKVFDISGKLITNDFIDTEKKTFPYEFEKGLYFLLIEEESPYFIKVVNY